MEEKRNLFFFFPCDLVILDNKQYNKKERILVGVQKIALLEWMYFFFFSDRESYKFAFKTA